MWLFICWGRRFEDNIFTHSGGKVNTTLWLFVAPQTVIGSIEICSFAPNILLKNCGWSITMIMLRLTYFTHSSIQTGCKSSMTWQTWPKVDLARKLILTSSSSSSSRSGWNWKAAPGWLLAFRLGLAREFIKFETIWWFLYTQMYIHTEGFSAPCPLSKIDFPPQPSLNA